MSSARHRPKGTRVEREIVSRQTELLARLNGVSRSGEGWTARCPAHEDRHNSLSIHNRDGRWLIKWLHRDCQAAWAAERDLDITSDLDRRGAQL